MCVVIWIYKMNVENYLKIVIIYRNVFFLNLFESSFLFIFVFFKYDRKDLKCWRGWSEYCNFIVLIFIFKYRYYGYWFYILFKRIIKMFYDKK